MLSSVLERQSAKVVQHIADSRIATVVAHSSALARLPRRTDMSVRGLWKASIPWYRHGRQVQHGRARNIAAGSPRTLCSAPASSSPGEDSNTTLQAFREVVISRTAGQKFSRTEVREDVLRDIMALTQSAPSALNVQPWSVVLVRDAAARERLSTAMLGGNVKKVMTAPVTAVFCADLEPSKRVQRMAQLQRQAGVPEAKIAELGLMVNLFSGEGLVGNVVRNAVTSVASPLQPAPEVAPVEAWSFKNTALAAQIYMLACSAHGLATCPMEGFDGRRVRAALDIPDRYGIPMVVATGFSAISEAGKAGEGRESEPGEHMRWRYPAREVVFDGAFGVGLEGIESVVP